MKDIKPKEAAKPCPNCGELNWISDLRFSSVKSIVCPPHGSIHSTLYGVCEKCANIHSK